MCCVPSHFRVGKRLVMRRFLARWVLATSGCFRQKCVWSTEPGSGQVLTDTEAEGPPQKEVRDELELIHAVMSNVDDITSNSTYCFLKSATWHRHRAAILLTFPTSGRQLSTGVLVSWGWKRKTICQCYIVQNTTWHCGFADLLGGTTVWLLHNGAHRSMGRIKTRLLCNLWYCRFGCLWKCGSARLTWHEIESMTWTLLQVSISKMSVYGWAYSWWR